MSRPKYRRMKRRMLVKWDVLSLFLSYFCPMLQCSMNQNLDLKRVILLIAKRFVSIKPKRRAKGDVVTKIAKLLTVSF